MLVRFWRFVTIMLAALSLSLSFCHLLEMPAKMILEYGHYRTAQSLYPLFGTVGAFLELVAIVMAALLAFLVRKRSTSFYLTLAGALCLAGALVSWFMFVAPMNAEMIHWSAGSPPSHWMQVRHQWEFSHAINAVIKLVGFAALVLSLLVETPTEYLPESSAQERQPQSPGFPVSSLE